MAPVGFELDLSLGLEAQLIMGLLRSTWTQPDRLCFSLLAWPSQDSSGHLVCAKFRGWG